MSERGAKSKGGLTAVAVFLAVAAIAGGVASWRRAAPAAAVASAGGGESAIQRDYDEAISLVTDNYADDIDYERATQSAIQGMLSTLDPHSSFFTKADFDRLRQDHESRFYGIGVSIVRHRDGVYVKSVVKGTPAERAGLRYGDRIVEVDGKDVRASSSDQVSKVVRGARGEPVRVKVERAGSEAPLYFTVVRDSVPLPSIRTAFMLRPGTGYVALIGGFTSTTSEELEEALARLDEEGMRQLVLDLRNNPGGLLPQAVKVASQFLPRGQTVVSVRGRSEHRGETVTYKNTEFDSRQDDPLVVLVNRNSASASEIVAGAIQDHGRGLLVGETSFGKGLVQHVFELKPWGCGLTLTTQKYFTPYGRSIQRDYSNGSLYDYYVRHDEQDEPRPAAPHAPTHAGGGETTAASPTPEPTPPPHPTGPAVKTAAGRVFYGGGGITPDIEVKPLDAGTPARGRVFDAAFYFARQLVAGQVQGLENYRIDKVSYGQQPRATDYPVNDRVVEALRAFVRKESERIGLTPAQLEAEMDYARIRLRDEIVTAGYGQEAGQRTLLEHDPQLMRALEAFPDARRLAELIKSGASSS